MKKLILVITILNISMLPPIRGAEPSEKTSTPKKKTRSMKKNAPHKKKPSTKKPRTKTTTAGGHEPALHKKKVVRKTNKKSSKKTPASAVRQKKTTYGQHATKTKNPNAPAKNNKKPKQNLRRTTRKKPVTYRHFKQLEGIAPQATLGLIKKPTEQIVSLSEPQRGYKHADYLTFTTQDNKTGHIVLRSHELTTERAEQKGLEKLNHIGQKSVEVFAGTDPQGKGLVRVGEFGLLNANLKGPDDLKVIVHPDNHVEVEAKSEDGSFKPLTQFGVS